MISGIMGSSSHVGKKTIGRESLLGDDIKPDLIAVCQALLVYCKFQFELKNDRQNCPKTVPHNILLFSRYTTTKFGFLFDETAESLIKSKYGDSRS
jgi:hypothetical protein